MPTQGQPNLYNPTYCELARDYCLVGATNEVLADYFGVTRRTIQNWIATYPDFVDAVRIGRIVADAKVARALFEHATGFYGKVTRTTRQSEHWQARAEAPPELEVIDHDLAGDARCRRRAHAPCGPVSFAGGTSGVAEIAENKFYVVRSAHLG